MNYIKQLTEFWTWAKSSNAKPQYRMIYLALLEVNNGCGWKPVFRATYGEVMELAGLTSKTTYYSGLKFLEEAGLVRYQSGSNRFESPSFMLTPLPMQVNVEVLSSTATLTSSGKLQKKPKLKKTVKKPIEVLNKESTFTSSGNIPKHITNNNIIVHTVNGFDFPITGIGDPDKIRSLANHYFSMDAFRDAFRSWQEMRSKKGKRHAITDRGRELILMELDTLSKKDIDLAQKIMEQSEVKNWDGIWPLKGNQQQVSKQAVKADKFAEAKNNLMNL